MSLRLPPQPEQVSHFSNPDNDPNGPWFDGNPLNSPNPRENLRYTITSPSGVDIPPPPNGWRWSRDTLKAKLQSREIRFTADEKSIRRRTYLRNHKGLPASSLWVDLTETGHNRQAKVELKRLFPGVATCECTWTETDPGEYFPSAERHEGISSSCEVHLLIGACADYCGLVDVDWRKVADWYHLHDTIVKRLETEPLYRAQRRHHQLTGALE